MTAKLPPKAMVLAAGLGLRMRPITEHLPKPLIPVAGRSLLDRILDQLAAAGVEDAVVNVHYLAEIIERHLADRGRPRISLSRESARLETGGGIALALPLFGGRPFLAINGDVLWRDGHPPTLSAMAAAWDPRDMDALLLVHPTATALGYEGPGDFTLGADGRLNRRTADGIAPLLFAGIQILHPRLFADAPDGAFSLNVLYDRAIVRGRLFGTTHAGGWCHVGTPADIRIADTFVAGTALPDYSLPASR